MSAVLELGVDRVADWVGGGHVVISRAEFLQGQTDAPVSEVKAALWFAEMWSKHGRPGQHLRAVHYTLVSLGTLRLPPGVRPHTGRGRPAVDPVLDAIAQPYENSNFCWTYLLKSANAARYWRLVDARAFEEHRSAEPMLCAAPPAMRWTPSVALPRVWPDADFPTPDVLGYDYRVGDQPVTVELWCEKSTMDDVLAPVCRALHLNLQPLTGYPSVTRLVEMLCRAHKPTVVLYISDLDPAGCHMPTAFADALRHYGPIYAPTIPLWLKPIALTEEQVTRYHLPRNVIDADHAIPYNNKFRAEHPEGPCELDALETLRPGTLAQIVRHAVEPFIDHTLSGRLRHAELEAEQIVTTAWTAQTAAAREQLAPIDEEIRKIWDQESWELAAVREKFRVTLTPLIEQRDAIRTAVLNQRLDVDLPARPEPTVTLPRDGWIVSS